MPMQPRPSAETSRLLFPSLRFCIVLSSEASDCLLQFYVESRFDEGSAKRRHYTTATCGGLSGKSMQFGASDRSPYRSAFIPRLTVACDVPG